MRRKSSKYLFILCTLIFMLSLGCTNTGEKINASLGQQFVLSIGQTARIDEEDFEIRFENLLEDSRCPRYVTCVWAGQVRCRLSIGQNESLTSLEITQTGLADLPSIIMSSKYRMSYQVQPYPEANKEIAPEEYRLILKVEKN